MQVEGLMPLLITPEPGKPRYFEEMLPEGVKASKADVSYHPLPMLGTDWGVRMVS